MQSLIIINIMIFPFFLFRFIGAVFMKNYLAIVIIPKYESTKIKLMEGEKVLGRWIILKDLVGFAT